MATAVRTRRPGTIAASKTTTGIVTETISAQIVHKLLLGSLSSVTFLRDLFDDDIFQEVPTESLLPGGDGYERSNGRSVRRGSTGTTMRVIQRGRSPNSDQLLDWLEKGALDALTKKVLRALQLNIFEDPTHPQRVLESYTFTFAYRGEGQDSNVTMGFQGPTGGQLTLYAARHSLHSFLKRVVTLCGDIPELPRRRYLSMQLFYTEDCDPNYQPVGFEPYSDDSLYFPSSNGWKRTSISFGKCDSGHHKVNLNLSYTLPDESWAKANAREQADRFKMPTIPENLVYGEEVSTEMDIDQSVVSMESPSQRETGNSRPSTLEMPPPPTQQSFEGAEYTQASAQVQSSQASKYPVPRLDDRIQLQGASPAPSYVPGSQGEIAPTQDTVGRIEVGLTKELQAVESIDVGGDTQEMAMDLSTEDQSVERLRLMPSIIDDLHRLQLGLQSAPDSNPHGVRCQCRSTSTTASMIQCSFCHKHQHTECYGFKGVDDPRIPEHHACYECLLRRKDPSLLSEICNLALLRKAIKVIETGGYHTQAAFAQSLECDLRTAASAFNQLREKGFIVGTPGSKVKGFYRSGLSKFQVISSGPKFAAMEAELFNPEAKLGHLFEPAAAKELEEISQLPMPPPLRQPVTPRTQLIPPFEQRPRSPTSETTVSGFLSPPNAAVREGSMTQSSRKVVWKYPIGSKRLRQSDTAFGGGPNVGPPSKRARARSSRTGTAINVGFATPPSKMPSH